MNVLHINSETGWRGGERQIVYLVEEILAVGVGCAILCKKNSKLHHYCIERELPHYTASFRSAFDVGTIMMIRKLVRTYQYDLIHVHTPKAKTLSVIASSFLGLNVPIVFTKRTSFKIKKNALTLLKYNHHSIKKIIAISNRIADLLREVIKESDKIETVYSSIDLNNYGFQPSDTIREELGLSPNVRLIGIVAALSPEKDHFTFLRMAAMLRDNKNLHYVIVGEGPLENQLKEEVEKNNLKDIVHFIGFRKNVYELLPELNVLLLTSIEEGLGSVILDAFASKVPVVATNAGGIPELVKHEETGLIAPVKDHEKLAENVNRILNEPELKERLIINAYEFVQGFSKEKTAEKTLAVYREILADKS